MIVKHIISGIILIAVLILVINVRVNPEEYCYYQGMDDIFYNEYNFNDLSIIKTYDQNICAQSKEELLESKHPFLQFILIYETIIGLSLILIAGLIYILKKKNSFIYKKNNSTLER